MSKVEITLQDILWCLKKYFVWIILTTVVFGVGSWIYTTNYVTPTYSTRMSFSIRASNRNGESITANEQSADATLANNYCDLIISDIVVEKVEAHLSANGVGMSASEIKGMLVPSASQKSSVIHLKLTGSDPQKLYLVAQAIAAVAPNEVPSLAGVGEMVLINRPTKPTEPISPIVKDNVTIGIVLGVFLSCAVIILIAVLDTTIWREEDLERTFDIPVLGSVPSMNVSQHISKNRRNP